ncbi:MAG: Glutamate-1-semialdehyde 2,1-aminomutase [Desulfotomaculum sp. 46_296]|nr:MAG: Glutamate-1-semialdehyde 2,1-aminomutase [Desulfotomaculum sp. 46_296]HAU32640.1 glutamate-1-semialdehyde-2,1-aminomutase [Desulfotomaculum sp.]
MQEKRYLNSAALFDQAKRIIPGGVNSPVRAFKAVGGNPVFIEKGRGSNIFDADGNKYIDYVCSWGPLILGHCHPEVVKALKECVELGTSYGAPTELETNLAGAIVAAVPSIDMVRLVNSGTEAVMSSLRLARAFTGRDKIVKFEGCYHGHADSMLVKAGSGSMTLGLPDSPGVPGNAAADTIVSAYNDLDMLEAVFKKEGKDIAAMIVEPVAGNMGVVPPDPGFLKGIRDLAGRFGSLLIFDEVITGFRVAYGGAQELYGVKPDLTCLGKVIGGGLPVGAYGGRREIMERIAPQGPVYQAGTLSGNPLAVTAGLATLKILRQNGFYEHLESKGARLADGLARAAAESGAGVAINRVGSMVSLFFTADKVTDYNSACRSDTNRYAQFFKKMLDQGIYLAPSQFETWFISSAHSGEDIDLTIQAVQNAL